MEKNLQLFIFADSVDCVLNFLVLIRNIYMFYVIYIYHIYIKSLAVPKVNSLRMYSIIRCSVTDRVKKI